MVVVDLVIVNYNTKDLLQRLLDNLHIGSYLDFRIDILDNGSTDGSAEWLMHFPGDKYPLVRSVTRQKNMGYARACNFGAMVGDGSVVGFLNADVWLSSEDVRAIAKAFDDPEVGILGPKQRDEKGNITHAGIVGDNVKLAHRGWQQADPRDVLFRDRIHCPTVSGSAYFVRRTVWDALTECPLYREVAPEAEGAFLPTPHYFEETFCSYHARAHGYNVVYDGSISIGHTWHASSPKGGITQRYFAVSRDIFRKACDFHGIAHD